LSFTAFPLDT